METNFEKDIAIDKHSLDIEWEKQPALFEKYARASVEATAERDRKKLDRDTTIAELRLKILNFYNEQGSKKPTENAIDAEIIISEEHKQVSENLIAANEKVGLTDAAKWAMQQKRDALENMVKLHLAGYFSDPKIPQEAKDEADKTTRTELKRRLKK